MVERKVFSLTNVTKAIQKVLSPVTKVQYWIKAEISEVSQKNRHYYIDLIETNKEGNIIAKLKCNIWSTDVNNIKNKFTACGLDLNLEKGNEVCLLCSIQYHEIYGLSLKAVDADPEFALGKLELHRREILMRLQHEALLEENSGIDVSKLPIKIGLISSFDTAAYNDFIKTLDVSGYHFQVYFINSTMQGKYSESKIYEALNVLEKKNIDLVVIIRGGGSKAELYSLDSEKVARKIAKYRLPVWTGIGHEIDKGILDFVANQHFKTPTAVAEELVGRFKEMDDLIKNATKRISSIWHLRFKQESESLGKTRVGMVQGTRKLIDLSRSYLFGKASNLSNKVTQRLRIDSQHILIATEKLTSMPINMLAQQWDRLSNFSNMLQKSPLRFLSESDNSLKSIISRFTLPKIMRIISVENDLLSSKYISLRANDPRRNLKRGYSLVYNSNNTLVKQLSDIHENENENIEVEISDGYLNGKILNIRNKSNE